MSETTWSYGQMVVKEGRIRFERTINFLKGRNNEEEEAKQHEMS
jgi:hypothetical protein